MEKLIKTCIISCLILLAILPQATGQTSTIRGFIFDNESDEAMVLAHVYLENTTLGAITDKDGYYSIGKIPAGTYTLISQSLGYLKQEISVEISAGEIISKNIHLEKSKVQLDAAIISGTAMERRSRVQLSQIRLTPSQIYKIPTMGISADLAQYVQILPGVISSGDQGGQLYIRGGSPVQNLVLMDGIPLYNPFHSMGMFSVFDTDMISNANISTGGYPAKYGGRISSVMDVSLKDGNKNRLGGKIALGTMSANLALEGPLRFSKKAEPITFLLSGKYSFIDKTGEYLNPKLKEQNLPFSFYDFIAKLSYKGKSGSKISTTGFHFNDKVKLSEDQLYEWSNYGIGLQAVILPPASAGLIRTELNFSNYSMNLSESFNNKRYSEVEDIKVGMEFMNHFANHELRMGVQVLGVHTDYYNENTFGYSLDEKTNTTDLGAFLSIQLNYPKLLIHPGFRLNYFASLGRIFPEPRIGLKWLLNDKIRLKAGGGFYSQNLVSGKSDRDVVNFFTGFLMDPSNIANDTGQKQLPHRLQTSWQGILGFEWDPSTYIMINIEGFYKYFPQLISLNSNKRFTGEINHWDMPGVFYKDFITETGNAYGIEGLVQYERKRTYFWMAYSYSISNRFDGLQYFHPHYDRRHNLNLVGSYLFGKNLNWKVLARWNFGSGFPFTPTNAIYEKLRLNANSSWDMLIENGLIGINFGAYNSARLPNYHRLDISLKYIHHYSEQNSLEAVFSISNLYNRENLFYFSREDYKRINQLPLLPSGGIIWRF
ncbi:MAG: TonB-dependent receptor [Bacteroidetes bacterium]|jgi:hypothetical protein|nr:TonB-dependent receptor [Bacteroidota bacterium]MBT4400124.1 TonB-dependent receptor [Bacteroidota bacterium]MBT4408339.1 TonB-dependent receptor [Bacteroidota bacterium]MBT7092217.1 TonB-dependent receptor [Bacteroidota bacterium]MBT7463707.1 TonB-dependent receptor [Bacteroidota bacterium]